LALAGLLAAGLDGVENATQPPPLFVGDVYAADHLPQVPRSLRDATNAFADSEFVRDTFGAAMVDHYIHFFRTEQAAFDRAVTDWERKRYFERI
jgi:glutamine synthetase